MTLIDALASRHAAFATCDTHGLFPCSTSPRKAAKARCPECEFSGPANLLEPSSSEKVSVREVTYRG